MISRITQIKGIGKYINCHIGGRQLGVNTIIFGHNTGGKSTLTDILWSFKTGDTSFIEGRKSFGFFGNQIVEIVDENNNVIKYPSAAWNNGYENIEIFDTQFINENVFEGSEIKYGNQKKLHSIIIGQEGKRLSDEINSSQEKFAEITKEKADRTKYFNQTFSNKISIADFQRLPKYTNPEGLITDLKETINVASNQQKIKSVFDWTFSLIDNITNQTTKRILSQTIQTNAELVTSHILKTWKDTNHSKDFLQTGLILTKENKENCVFCGQYLTNDAIELLKAYSQLFSEEYKSFITM
ncbi:MAG: AAA family ATPase [Bacteroidota bacterium]